MHSIFIFLALAASAAAQITTGSVSGYVLDPSHHPILSARVTVTDSGRSLTRSTLTDVTGFFRVADLLPSAYRLSAAADGFATRQSLDVEVPVWREGGRRSPSDWYDENRASL